MCQYIAHAQSTWGLSEPLPLKSASSSSGLPRRLEPATPPRPKLSGYSVNAPARTVNAHVRARQVTCTFLRLHCPDAGRGPVTRRDREGLQNQAMTTW